MRRKKNLDARIAQCSQLLIERPETLKGRWLQEFGQSALHMEIGCGKGRFTVEAALKSPETLIVALEKSAGAIINALERSLTQGLQNVRFINNYADYLESYFAPGEVSRIYINFCDPWPASRHEKKRLTSKPFLEVYSQVLALGGEIHFKTDNLQLFEFSLFEFERVGFKVQNIARDLHSSGPVGLMTDYELKFYEKGQPIYRCTAEKSSKTSTSATFSAAQEM